MTEKLNFSLPEKKQKSAITNSIIIILLLILIGLSAANMVIRQATDNQTPKITSNSLTAEQTKQLAGKLAQRNLYTRAANLWQDYLASGGLSDTERAKTLFQVGTLLEKANLYEKAIEYFYRSEIVAEIGELKPQINAHIRTCFEKLGKFSALRYELMDRTSIKETQAAGAKIVAEIGAEKITEADLDGFIENEIENQLEPMAAFMTPEQLGKQKKKMLEQYKNPQAKQQYLQMWLAQEVLYRQALEEELAEKPEAKTLIDNLTRGALSQLQMNNELASKINITETDVQTYYTANEEKFIDPAKASISHILVEDQQKAKELIEKIKAGEDFGELAKQFSKDESTREKAGRIETDTQEGSYVAGIGAYEELNKKIFAAGPGIVLDEPFEADKGWEIVKVETITPERQKTLDEVSQQVISMLANQKRQDVQSSYIEQMMNKHNVIIHTSVFGSGSQTEPQEAPAGAPKTK